MLRPSAAMWIASVLIGTAGAAAAPPEDADPKLAPWFESLKQPGSGVSCCSIADCRPAEYRLVANGYEAYLDAKWVPVPDNRVLRHQPNPVGRAVVCRSPLSGLILCFVPASDT